MKITAILLTGRTKIFEIEPGEKVLKLKLLASEWLAVHHHSLKVGYYNMDSNRTFESYGITADTKIPVILTNRSVPLHDLEDALESDL
ncbi:unnamed protein product [Adineta ricciae]|nr:unnamed protein product [Adineta ricciae]